MSLVTNQAECRACQHSHSRITSLPAALRTLLLIIVCSVTFFATDSYADVTAVLVQDGLNNPIYVTSPPDDFERLFVVEQAGTIRIIKNGTLLSEPFLDLTGQVTFGGEQGLLGLAFHPDYDQNGYFFVNYTDGSGDSHVARFTVSSNPDSADENSEEDILVVGQPFANHNAGMLDFSPIDGYLYVGYGDGGSAGDPGNRAQDSTTFLGKMLRIDVDSGLPYSVPSDNPFVGDAAIEDEIWAFGLRNPWRYSFDRANGDLYIADVGQNSWEEIDYQPASSSGGENYGWRWKEGTHCYDPPSGCDPGGLTDPIHEYGHVPECSVTGGFVYRGCAIPDLQGTYFFADYCSDKIWSFRYDGANLTEFTDRTADFDPPSADIGSIVSFGEDAYGEMYIVDVGGEIFKIVSTDTVDCNENGTPDGCDIEYGASEDNDENGIPDECETFLCGDTNTSGGVDIDDVVYLIAYVFQGGPDPIPAAAGDVNCSGAIDIDDVVYEIAYVFQGGAPPCDPDDDGTPDC